MEIYIVWYLVQSATLPTSHNYPLVTTWLFLNSSQLSGEHTCEAVQSVRGPSFHLYTGAFLIPVLMSMLLCRTGYEQLDFYPNCAPVVQLIVFAAFAVSLVETRTDRSLIIVCNWVCLSTTNNERMAQRELPTENTSSSVPNCLQLPRMAKLLLRLSYFPVTGNLKKKKEANEIGRGVLKTVYFPGLVEQSKDVVIYYLNVLSRETAPSKKITSTARFSNYFWLSFILIIF